MQRRHYTSLAFWAIARHEAFRSIEPTGPGDEIDQPLGQEPSYANEQPVEMTSAPDLERAA